MQRHISGCENHNGGDLSADEAAPSNRAKPALLGINRAYSHAHRFFSSGKRHFSSGKRHFSSRKYTEQRRAEDRTEEESRAEHSREQQGRNKIENGELRYPCAASSCAAHITIKFFRRVWRPQKVNCPKGKRGHPGVPRRVNRLHIAKNCIVLPVFRISWREIAISWREMGISWRESTQSREENRRAENSTVQ